MTETPPCFDVTSQDNTLDNLKKLQSISLDDKILYTKVKIQQYYLKHKGKVCVSFSGGKDSTVLLHLVRSIYPEVKGVFIDTGLEFPEIRDYVKSYDNIDWIKPKMSFRKVIDKFGYPVIGKMAAHWINGAKKGWASAPEHFREDSDSIFNYSRYAYIIDAPFKVSERCCDVLKKKPAKDYYLETGLAPMLGIRASEGVIRRNQFTNKGKDKATKYPQLNPLAIWLDKDINEYIERNNIRLAEVYYKGMKRTGCVFCMFGIMSDKDRFVRLKARHPQLWEYCMRDYDKGGLGIKTVLDYIGIPTGYEQKNLSDFVKEDDEDENTLS